MAQLNLRRLSELSQVIIAAILLFAVFGNTAINVVGDTGGGATGLKADISNVASKIQGNINELIGISQTADKIETDTSNIASDTGTIAGKNVSKEPTLQDVRFNTRNNTDLAEDFKRAFGPSGQSVDAFGTQLSKDAISLLSVPSNHQFSPERLRILVNGTRQFYMYNGDLESYEKAADAHLLRPRAGENVTMETAESIPYIVHYENWYSWALGMNRSLQTGDVVRIGAFNDDNGYFLEHTGSDGPLEATLKTRRLGVIVNTVPVTLAEPLTRFTRLELRSNWYNVGRQQWIQTTTNLTREEVQKNIRIGITAPEGDRTLGPASPTVPLRWQIHRGTGNPPIQLEAGSGAIMIAGSGDLISRVKADRHTTELNDTGKWQPIGAIRIAPNYSTIRGEFTELDAAKFTANADVALTAQSHSPRKVRSLTGETPIPDSQWSRPALQSRENSIIQFTSNVSGAADENGTIKSLTTDIGGFQVGWGSIYTTGNQGAAAASARITRKRPLYGSDVIVFWAKVDDDDGNPSLPADFTWEYIVEMDY